MNFDRIKINGIDTWDHRLWIGAGQSSEKYIVTNTTWIFTMRLTKFRILKLKKLILNRIDQRRWDCKKKFYNNESRNVSRKKLHLSRLVLSGLTTSKLESFNNCICTCAIFPIICIISSYRSIVSERRLKLWRIMVNHPVERIISIKMNNFCVRNVATRASKTYHGVYIILPRTVVPFRVRCIELNFSNNTLTPIPNFLFCNDRRGSPFNFPRLPVEYGYLVEASA